MTSPLTRTLHRTVTYTFLLSLYRYWILQLAKLRMLEFYYLFLDRYLQREDFELLEMDTDSLYLAIAAPSLQEAVRPALKTEFYSEYPK